jgi:hypothetical protein
MRLRAWIDLNSTPNNYLPNKARFPIGDSCTTELFNTFSERPACGKIHLKVEENDLDTYK